MINAVTEIQENGRALALTLALGLAGALVFVNLRLPLPWVTGPLFSVAIVGLLGWKVWIPKWFRSPMVMVIGALFGMRVSKDLMSQIVDWLPSMVGVCAYVMFTATVLTAYLVYVGKYDFKTAFFSGAPGGIIPMTLLGEAYGADARAIALIQSLRLILTVLTIPIAFRLFAGYEPSGNAGTGADLASFAPIDIPIMLAAAMAGSYAAKFLRIPTPQLMGPMIVVAALNLGGVVESEIPDPVVALAQLIIGINVAIRFDGVKFKTIRHDLIQGAILSVMMIALALAFAVLLSWITGLPVKSLILAFAPGGFAEMALIGFGLGIDVTFVVAHQLMRYMFIVLSAPVAISYLTRGSRRS